MSTEKLHGPHVSEYLWATLRHSHDILSGQFVVRDFRPILEGISGPKTEPSVVSGPGSGREAPRVADAERGRQAPAASPSQLRSWVSQTSGPWPLLPKTHAPLAWSCSLETWPGLGVLGALPSFPQTRAPENAGSLSLSVFVRSGGSWVHPGGAAPLSYLLSPLLSAPFPLLSPPSHP